ncbi:MAG: glycoside hydrolase family 3 C-terminal domain-containing protein [Odoribacteraceae bacterium]|jgi:beta-glucosidase|nr:glycoside hydrolase family 3 C-terminal domain-containing protein [Odoribacteraceae bacterium]
MKTLVTITCALLVALSSRGQGIYCAGWIDFNKNGVKDVYEDPAETVERRVADLLSRMTVEEKTCQMATLYGSGRVLRDTAPTAAWKEEVWKDGIANVDEQANGLGSFRSRISYPYTASVRNRRAIQRWFVEETRLGIPVDFTNEGIRGLCHDRATMFPAQCGQGASWNRELVAAIADVTATEALALGYTHVYAPVMDVARDPRWGRVVECYGEDPFLVGELGAEMIRGLQARGVASTLKHFAVYSVPAGGRDAGTRTDPGVGAREMRTLFLEPFRAGVAGARATGVMSSYNDYDGVPVTGSHRFLTGILREEWGFDGYVTSDSEAVEFLMTKHRVSGTIEEAVARAVNAGLNVRTNFTPPADFVLPLRRAIRDGLVTMETIDERVAGVLRVKFRLGLFDDPYRGDTVDAGRVHSPRHRELALEAALQSIVLLKNDGTLPLSRSARRVAVIGPNADETRLLECRYGPANPALTSVYKGVAAFLPGAEVMYAKGCEVIDAHFPESEMYDVPLDETERRAMDEAVETARRAEVVVLVLGGNERTVGESRSRTTLDLPGRQDQLAREVCATGRPVVLVLLDGRASSINWAARHMPAIVHAWFPGEATGEAVARVLFGAYHPGGKLPVTFPRSVGQVPLAFPFKPGADSEGTVRVNGALYPFGHGLSYTTFEYSGLALEWTRDDTLRLRCRVRNAGRVAGDEVVQVYARDEVSSVTTHERSLRGFTRVHLAAGEEREVCFSLPPRAFGLWDERDRFVVEPGAFTLMVGSSSTDIRLTGQITIEKERVIEPSRAPVIIP